MALRLGTVKAVILVGLGFACFAVSPALASCYGTGYNRYCDGIGGSGATYSPRGGDGSTTYQNRGGGTSRTETYTTTPIYGVGYTRQTRTDYYGR